MRTWLKALVLGLLLWIMLKNPELLQRPMITIVTIFKKFFLICHFMFSLQKVSIWWSGLICDTCVIPFSLSFYLYPRFALQAGKLTLFCVIIHLSKTWMMYSKSLCLLCWVFLWGPKWKNSMVMEDIWSSISMQLKSSYF